MADSQFERKASDFLHGLIFDLLLVTDGRTTDLLEMLLNEKIIVDVIRQEEIGGEDANLMGESSGGPYYIRESVLIGEKSGFVVSHNIAVVYSKHIPPDLFEKIAHQQEGIGKAISSFGMPTFRKVVDSGFMNEAETIDLFQRPIKVHFSNLQNKVPYKRYYIYFGRKPGIQLLEYFHPSIIGHRLQQGMTKEQSNKEE
ncbi:4-hydroxybenzoate synthetase [Metabacillus sediminilitoris]|uniref:4-hydroxybenzoate synthetase n=1 Tax=Metabacillus sediminilitoris TaxID=2567941 RepID=A0A4S4BX04_9BACI|nr:4-hydroxybenzoate synthetase [Metabacillus sediminilitoris]QGQ45508.1 4-hydroxybenzoate synthetase [Metabacillus sediminilitoris]THF77634.1 4-hydroxybenzoate synthetase [Metabacillus sediminilitoris]